MLRSKPDSPLASLLGRNWVREVAKHILLGEAAERDAGPASKPAPDPAPEAAADPEPEATAEPEPEPEPEPKPKRESQGGSDPIADVMDASAPGGLDS